MFDYILLENQLNEEVKKILILIKEDYYDTLSTEKKSLLDDLLKSDTVVIVNQGISKFNDNTLAHGGRTLADGKVHFYPDTRKFKSFQEALDTCKKLLPHECFHYFIQSDKLDFTNRLEDEMAHFYTEGLVEKEARSFYEKHKNMITFEKANYGYNINFVNMVQDALGASSHEKIFGEDNYLKDIGKYSKDYEEILKDKKVALDKIEGLANRFPANLQSKIHNRMRTMVLQDGNVDSVVEKLKSIQIPTSYSKKSEKYDELEK